MAGLGDCTELTSTVDECLDQSNDSPSHLFACVFVLASESFPEFMFLIPPFV